jgi:hypothetical protein
MASAAKQPGSQTPPLQHTPLPSPRTGASCTAAAAAAKQQLQECVQLLHAAVAAAGAGAAQQAGAAAVQAHQMQQMRADLTVAAAGKESAERQVQELQGQLKLLQQQSDALRSELHVVSFAVCRLPELCACSVIQSVLPWHQACCAGLPAPALFNCMCRSRHARYVGKRI